MTTVDQLDYTRAIRLANGTDMNTVTDAGFYCGLNLGNAPDGGYWYVEIQRYSDDAGYCLQRFSRLVADASGGAVIQRQSAGGVWGSFVQFYTTANPPPASGNSSPPATGATADAKTILRREKRFNIRDYGADENADAGTNGNAFRAAAADLLASGGGTLVLGVSGVVNFDGDLNIDGGANIGVRVVGAESETTVQITSPNAQNGMVLNGKSVAAEGFGMICAADLRSKGGGLLYLRQASPLGSHFQTIKASDLRLEGRGPTLQPQNFLAICNPAFGRINNIGIVSFDNVSYGDKGNQGIYIFGEPAPDGSAVGDFSMQGCNVYGVETAYRILCGNGANGQQTVEGINATDCTTQGARLGWYLSAQGYQCPGTSIKGGHVNCDGAAFTLENMAQIHISEFLCYLNAASARKQGFVYLPGSTEINVHDNQFFHQSTTGQPVTGAGVFGVAMQNGASLCRIKDNDFFGFPNGSAAVYNASSGGGNRFGGNGVQAPGIIQAGGGLVDLGGNHQF